MNANINLSKHVSQAPGRGAGDGTRPGEGRGHGQGAGHRDRGGAINMQADHAGGCSV